MTLEEWLDERNITQKTLAIAIAKDISYVSKLIHFDVLPSLPVAILISKISGDKVRPENLMTERAFKSWCTEYHADPAKFESIIKSEKPRVKQKVD